MNSIKSYNTSKSCPELNFNLNVYEWLLTDKSDNKCIATDLCTVYIVQLFTPIVNQYSSNFILTSWFILCHLS